MDSVILSDLVIAAFFFIMGAAVIGIIWYFQGVARGTIRRGKKTTTPAANLSEVARLMRNDETQDMVVEIDGQAYKKVYELPPGLQHRLNFISDVLIKWLAEPAPEPPPAEEVTPLPLETAPVEAIAPLPPETTSAEEVTVVPPETAPAEEVPLVPPETAFAEEAPIAPPEAVSAEEVPPAPTEASLAGEIPPVPPESSAGEETPPAPAEGAPSVAPEAESEVVQAVAPSWVPEPAEEVTPEWVPEPPHEPAPGAAPKEVEPFDLTPVEPKTGYVPPFEGEPPPEVKPVSTQLADVVGGVLSPVPAPVPEFKSIAAQINDILQARLSGTVFESRGIAVLDGPEHGVIVTLEGQNYPGLKEVPDENVRELIRSAVQEWEQQGQAAQK